MPTSTTRWLIVATRRSLGFGRAPDAGLDAHRRVTDEGGDVDPRPLGIESVEPRADVLDAHPVLPDDDGGDALREQMLGRADGVAEQRARRQTPA